MAADSKTTFTYSFLVQNQSGVEQKNVSIVDTTNGVAQETPTVNGSPTTFTSSGSGKPTGSPASTTDVTPVGRD